MLRAGNGRRQVRAPDTWFTFSRYPSTSSTEMTSPYLAFTS